MKHYPITVCPCGTQYNPVKMGKLRPCPNEFCKSNEIQPEPVEAEPELDVTNSVPEPAPKKAPAKKAAAKKTKGK